MTTSPTNTALQAVADSLAAKLPARVVGRSLLADLSQVPQADLLAGVLCVVADAGSGFATHRGREADMGTLKFDLVGYVLVPDDQPPASVEQAELALLQDVLDWVANPGAVHPVNGVYPQTVAFSKQLDAPYGWVGIEMQTRP